MTVVLAIRLTPSGALSRSLSRAKSPKRTRLSYARNHSYRVWSSGLSASTREVGSGHSPWVSHPASATKSRQMTTSGRWARSACRARSSRVGRSAVSPVGVACGASWAAGATRVTHDDPNCHAVIVGLWTLSRYGDILRLRLRCRTLCRSSSGGRAPGWWNGRHGRLKSGCRKACGFETRPGHELNTVQGGRDLPNVGGGDYP